MTEHRWLATERHFGDLPKQALWLFQRGIRRPLVVALACALFAALIVGGVTLAKHTYQPRVVLRVIEADRDPTSMPELKRKLAEYVREGIFTAEPLLEIVHRYGLYPDLHDRRAQLEAFRRNIDVDVYQNYFVSERANGETPRSARVAVSFRASDRARAVAVTRDLGALVVARVTASREEQAERSAAVAETAAAAMQNRLTDRYREVAETHARMNAAPVPALQVKLVSLLGSLPGLERQADAANKRSASLDLGAAYENHGIGLYFDVAEDASAPLSDRRSSLRLVGAGLVFVFGVPLVVLGVGAGTFKRETA